MAAEEGNQETPPAVATPSPELAAFEQRTMALEAQNKQLAQQMEQLIALSARSQQSASQSATGVSDDEIEDLAYKNPKAYAKAVEQRATQKASDMVNSRLQHQNDVNVVLSQLTSEYPELGDASSDFAKKAVEIYSRMPSAQQNNPLAYKIAVRDAAAELGVLTKSKRPKNSSDDFSVSSSGQNSGTRESRKTDKLDNRSLAFAELLGMDVKDTKVIERIKARTNRKYGSWE